MSFGNTFEQDVMLLIFNATAIANIADNAASAPLTDLQVGLATASVGETGDQTTNEAAYGSYARVAVARTGGGWSVSAGAATPVANIDFPQASSGSETETDFHVGTASSGAGKVLAYGSISPTIAVSSGVTPRLTTATSISLD